MNRRMYTCCGLAYTVHSSDGWCMMHTLWLLRMMHTLWLSNRLIPIRSSPAPPHAPAGIDGKTFQDNTFNPEWLTCERRCWASEARSAA